MRRLPAAETAAAMSAYYNEWDPGWCPGCGR